MLFSEEEQKRIDVIEKKLDIKLDLWQKRIIIHDGDIQLRLGRQTGKTTGVAIKIWEIAINNPNKTYLVMAASLRQSGWLYDKIIGLFANHSEDMIVGEPTRTKIVLTNGTTIYCVPAGRTGYTVRGYTIDGLIVDEAAYVPDPVWDAVIPMLATTNGWQIILGTPFGKAGYYYDCEKDPDFLHIHRSSELCPRIPKSFLQKQKETRSRLYYKREYLAEYTSDDTQLFPYELINRSCTFLEWNYKKQYSKHRRYYLGVDIARYGGDENSFCVVELFPDKTLKLVHVDTTRRVALTDTMGRVLELHKRFNFNRIFVDDAGVGAGVADLLTEKLGRRVVGLNNARASNTSKDSQRVKILKEDLYNNLLLLMEQKRIQLIDSPQLRQSLASVQYEYTSQTGRLRIFGKYTHIAEGLIRACYCLKNKGLNIWAA